MRKRGRTGRESLVGRAGRDAAEFSRACTRTEAGSVLVMVLRTGETREGWAACMLAGGRGAGEVG